MRRFSTDVVDPFARLRFSGIEPAQGHPGHNPLVPDPDAVARAGFALCLSYLEKVRDHMSDYAEAAGQVAPGPQISMNISGGTFYGGQFAAQISNIDSAITTVVRDGDERLGKTVTIWGPSSTASSPDSTPTVRK